MLFHLAWVIAHYSWRITRYGLRAIGREASGLWYAEYNNHEKIYFQIEGFTFICGMLVVKCLQNKKYFYHLLGHDQFDRETYCVLRANLYG